MDKKKAVYVPTVGEEIGNALSHGVMSLLSLLALPFAAVWAYAHDPGGFTPYPDKSGQKLAKSHNIRVL